MPERKKNSKKRTSGQRKSRSVALAAREPTLKAAVTKARAKHRHVAPPSATDDLFGLMVRWNPWVIALRQQTMAANAWLRVFRDGDGNDAKSPARSRAGK